MRLRLHGPRVAAPAFACAVSAVAIMLPGHAGAASASVTAQEECTSEAFFYELYAAGVGTTLSPGYGGEVPAHSRVTFSGESYIAEPTAGHPEEIALSFEVASSESALAHPNIDSGPGAVGPGSEANRRKYTFVSSRAAAREGNVYWEASFVRHLAACNHGEARTFTTGGGFAKPFLLSVVKSEEVPPPTPAPGGSETTESHATPSGLRVGITASRLVHIGHAAVAYLVDCTKPCSGQTYIKAWQLRGRRKPARVSALDFGPRNVSISGSSGGNQRFVEHFRGQALRKLRRMLRGGHEVKLVVTAKVKDSSGAGVQVQRTILLKG